MVLQEAWQPTPTQCTLHHQLSSLFACRGAPTVVSSLCLAVRQT